MDLLSAVVAPIALDEFKKHFDDASCLVLKGHSEKFTQLVRPEDIERRINDGCNASAFPQVIKNASRSSPINANTAWCASSLRKTEFRQDLADGYSFMLSNSSQITPGIAQLCDEIEQLFRDDAVHADVHLYISNDDRGNSYNTHRDVPQHKLLLQAYGDTNWQLFSVIKDLPDNIIAVNAEQQAEHLELSSEFTLHQGDLLYMPPGTFHKVSSVGGPRISISIPFFSMPEANTMDRSFIAFAQNFRAELAH